MHIIITDANSLGYAQYHAQPIRWAGDTQTHAVYGMLNYIRRNLQVEKDALNIVVWDGRAQWRYDLFKEYKGNRAQTAQQIQDRALYEAQRPWIEKLFAALPVIQVKHPRAEADDLGWGLARQLSQQGHLVTVRTSDTDWLQMVNARTRWNNARKPSEVVELEGFSQACGYASPLHVPQVKALTGDTSDNIDGLVDVANKRANSLLAKYGSLEAVLAAAEDFMAFSSEPKHFHALMTPEGRERVLRNLQLVDLSKGPALQGDDVELQVGQYDELNLFEGLVDLNFLQLQDTYGIWARPMQKDLATSDVASVKRALKELHKSWAGA